MSIEIGRIKPFIRDVADDAGSLETRLQELLTMLTYRRPAGSKSERAFIRRFILPLGAQPDVFGNLWLVIGAAPRIMWSSHTDTVHHHGGSQRVLYGAGLATVAKGSNCLGADCTTGVWLMMHMARAGIPGVYVWHREEEVGGHGSRWIAKHAADRLDGVQFAMAFDRKGFADVVTHQGAARTASDAFARSFAKCLGMRAYQPSPLGIFTDTANYAELIPECSNLSIGYGSAHSSNEYQDTGHALALLDAILAADWSGLVCERDPKAPAVWWDDDAYDRAQSGAGSTFGSTFRSERFKLETLLSSSPDEVIDYLMTTGVTARDIEEHLWTLPSRS